MGADRVTIRASRLRNVRFGISVSGREAHIRGNLIDGFSADGLRGLGDYGLFEYNRVQNNYVGDAPDGNHDDGFQSWSVARVGWARARCLDCVFKDGFGGSPNG